MNIAFNLLSARAGAGISVSQTLMKAISQQDRENKYFVFVGNDQKDIIDAIPESFVKVIFKFYPINPFLRTLWEQIVLPFYIYKLKINVLYSVGNTTILLAPCKVLLFIENANPFTKIIKSWSFKEKIRNRLLFYLGLFSSRKATKIRFLSYRSQNIISRIYKIPNNKCFVLYHGLDFNKISVNKKKKIPFNYILSVSVVAPHKNFEVLIQAFSILKKQNLYDGKLVIIGNTECYPEYFKKLNQLVNKEGISKDVFFYGSMPNSEVFSFYENADLFVFPSLEETFGIPLVEALYLNKTCVVSDGMKYENLFIPFNEIAKNYAFYFDPFSPVDLVEKIKNALSKKEALYSRDFVISNYDITNVAKVLISKFKEIGAQ